MHHLNYTHLLYFWTVAREGSIAKAAQSLHLAPQTISGQLKLLEGQVGERLFRREGRGLVLTDMGLFVKQYADEIFQLGSELTQHIQSQQALMPVFRIGVLMSIPKLIALRIIEPIMSGVGQSAEEEGLEIKQGGEPGRDQAIGQAIGQEIDQAIEQKPVGSEIDPVLTDTFRPVCREGDLDFLLAELAMHKLDLVISDRPLPSGSHVKAFNHPLGESGVSIFGPSQLAQHIENFPNDLDGAPMLLPVANNTLRRNLEDWFERHGVVPRNVAEFDDSALMCAFGEAGLGLFAAPTAIAAQVCTTYKVKLLGHADIKERYYAISPERRVKHPGVLAINERARRVLI